MAAGKSNEILFVFSKSENFIKTVGFSNKGRENTTYLTINLFAVSDYDKTVFKLECIDLH